MTKLRIPQNKSDDESAICAGTGQRNPQLRIDSIPGGGKSVVIGGVTHRITEPGEIDRDYTIKLPPAVAEQWLIDHKTLQEQKDD